MAVSVDVNPNVEEHVMVAYEKQVIFLTWVSDFEFVSINIRGVIKVLRLGL